MDLNFLVQDYFIYNVRNVNKYSVEKFKIGLSCAYWDCAFGNNNNMDVDSLLNAFLNNYLRILYTSFPLQKIIERCNNKSWITAGIKISCQCKRELYLLSRVSSDTNLKNYYKQYCKVLTNVIREAKRSMYHNHIIISTVK
jgi:hypothetical protein